MTIQTPNVRIATLAAALLTSPLTAQSWEMYQSDASHTGAIPNVIQASSLKKKWNVTLGTGFLNPVSAAGGKVFVTSFSKTLWAVNGTTGKIDWSKNFSTAFSVNPPSVSNGRVYVQTGNHASDTYLRCYDAKTGGFYFRAPHAAQWERYYAPTIYKGSVYVNGGQYGGMYGFDGTSGQQHWYLRLAQVDRWTPAVDDKYVYSYISGLITVADRATGTVAYTIKDAGAGSSRADLGPVLGGRDDMIILQGRRLARINLLTRKLEFGLASNYKGAPAVGGGVIYAINDNTLEARSQDDGRLLWTWSKLGQILNYNVVLTGAHVLVSGSTSTFVIDLQTKKDVAALDATGYIAVADDSVIIAGNGGSLSSYGFKQLPQANVVSPARIHYAHVPSTVTIQGTAFQQGTDMKVWIGGVPCTNVNVIDDTTLTCTPPKLMSQVSDVRVENSLGTRTLSRGVVYYPTQEVAGAAQIGGDVTLVYHCARRDHVWGLVGLQLASPVRIPGIAGTLDVGPALIAVAAAYWYDEEMHFTIPIPNDPSLRGLTAWTQGLTAPSAGSNSPAFTNSQKIVVR